MAGSDSQRRIERLRHLASVPPLLPYGKFTLGLTNPKIVTVYPDLCNLCKALGTVVVPRVVM